MIRSGLPLMVALSLSAGCGPGEVPKSAAEPAPDKVYLAGTTPEQTIEQFIEAQRAGNAEAARAHIYPDDSPYKLERPVEIKSFQIIRKIVLTAEDAAEYVRGPPRMEGDVMLDVYEEYALGRTSRNEYFLREIGGGWRIYALSFQP